MTRRLYVHVGPFKTGSTYIQNSMRERRAELRDLGIHVAMVRGGGNDLAIVDLLDRRKRLHAGRQGGAWQLAVDEIAAWAGDVALLSSETLSTAGTETVQRILDAMGEVEVHLIVTLRDLSRLVPSFWQSNLRNHKSVTWPEFIASLRGATTADPRFGERFWRVQDASRIAGVWAELIPTDRIHVIVMPPSGAPASELWHRFLSVLGVDDPPPPVSEQAVNTAVGTAQSEALRRLNRSLGDTYPRRLYTDIVKKIAMQTAKRETANVRPVVLPPEDFEWARDESQRIVAAIARGGTACTAGSPTRFPRRRTCPVQTAPTARMATVSTKLPTSRPA